MRDSRLLYFKELDGNYYHVWFRGSNRFNVFYTQNDYTEFLCRLDKMAIKHDTQISAFVLMSNHVHLQVRSNQLTKFMISLLISYTHWYNKKYEMNGQLFGSPFSSSAIHSWDKLEHNLLYILTNPIRAGICKSITEYPWSSFFYCRAHEKQNSSCRANNQLIQTPNQLIQTPTQLIQYQGSPALKTLTCLYTEPIRTLYKSSAELIKFCRLFALGEPLPPGDLGANSRSHITHGNHGASGHSQDNNGANSRSQMNHVNNGANSRSQVNHDANSRSQNDLGANGSGGSANMKRDALINAAKYDVREKSRIRHNVPDSEIAAYYMILLNGRRRSELTMHEVEKIARALMYNGRATLRQVCSILHVNYHQMRLIIMNADSD